MPTLISGKEKTDLIIRVGEVSATVTALADPQEFLLRASPDEVCFQSPFGVTCLVKAGREIIVSAPPDIDPNLLCHFIAGMPLAMVLHQRGNLVLHASAVAIEDQVVAFLGHSGQGKSTTSAALHQQGYPLITDDILALDLSPAIPITVLPSYPQMRLLPESAQSVGSEPEALPRIFREGEKRSRLLTKGFQSTPLPLQAIYVLVDGEHYRATQLPMPEAFLAVTEQSYPYQALLEATNTVKQKFEHTSALVKQVPVYRLERPRNLNALTELSNFIASHAVGLVGG